MTMINQQRGANASEPRFTAKYVHIPQLREKLERLYGHHPTIKTQYELARELDVAPSTLSAWLSGVRYGPDVAPVNPNSSPAKHFRRFKEIWGVPEKVLQAEDIREFGIRNRDGDEEGALLHLGIGDEIMLRVGDPGLPHGLMLLQDRSGWASLRPTARLPTTEIDGAMVFPRQYAQAPPRFAEIESPTGMHRALAIFTAEPLPAGVLDILLQEPIDTVSLNHIATVFQRRIAAGPDRCRMLSRRFLVSGNTV